MKVFSRLCSLSSVFKSWGLSWWPQQRASSIDIRHMYHNFGRVLFEQILLCSLPVLLDMPAMLFFFLHDVMSFLRARNSQMSCNVYNTSMNAWYSTLFKNRPILYTYVYYYLEKTSAVKSGRQPQFPFFFRIFFLCFIVWEKKRWYRLSVKCSRMYWSADMRVEISISISIFLFTFCFLLPGTISIHLSEYYGFVFYL